MTNLKKSFISAFLILVSGIGGMHTAYADNLPAGTWNVFPIYSNPPQKVIDTDNIVYYTVNGSLFSFDKKEQESHSFTSQNKLNDNNITDIHYNFVKHYLLVCYSSGNIDIIYDDGRVKNLADIRDSYIDPPLTISDVLFDGDNIYVATAFGLVKFNEPRGEVVTSGRYGGKVNAVASVGDKLMIHFSDNYYYAIDKDAALNSLAAFKKMYSGGAPTEVVGVDNNKMLVWMKDNGAPMTLHTVDFTTGNKTGNQVMSANHTSHPSYISFDAEGNMRYVADGKLYEVGPDYKESLLAPLPEEWKEAKISTCEGQQSLWVLDNTGMANYSVDNVGSLTMNMDHFRPDAFPVKEVRVFFPSSDAQRLYAQNYGVSAYRYGGATRALDKTQTTGYIDLTTGELVDVTPYPVEGVVNIVKVYQRTYGKYALSPTGMAEDPKDPSTYFLATGDDGLYKITNGEIVGRYGHLNCPLEFIDNRDIFYGCSFDRGGNLWAMRYADGKSYQPLIVLPAEKVALDPDQVTIDDWIELDLSKVNYMNGMDTRFLHCQNSNLSFMSSTGTRKILAYDNRGTHNDFTDDRYVLIEKMNDQDGKEFAPTWITCFTEDLNGKVWVGTNIGVIEINPKGSISQTTEIQRLKVPRNDGTNLADYLLGTDFINDIAIDGANRKWIATSASGLFVVSPEGDKIIGNFTKDNSPLTTNFINCVYVDRPTGVVYIGTDNGLYSYASDVTAPKENYDDILVYPNPVKPDFFGDVTITGLMENSLVKIADASGAVVHQGRSEAGRFTWNCCNASGVRVKTGVYYVMVSQNSTGSASAAVAKIMVVN